ncbi:MAG: MerR family transcriptional regulator [Beijerinckiaceae bacterium]
MSTAHIVANKSLSDFIADQISDTEVIGIGEMAQRFNTTLRTLRFYEARGLLKPRREGSMRLYDVAAQKRFRLIDEGRKLGFTLTEITELLGSSRNITELNLSIQIIKDQIIHLERQRVSIDEALADLRRRYYLLTDPGSDE